MSGNCAFSFAVASGTRQLAGVVVVVFWLRQNLALRNFCGLVMLYLGYANPYSLFPNVGQARLTARLVSLSFFLPVIVQLACIVAVFVKQINSKYW